MLARRVANATSNMKLDQGHLLSLPKVKEYLLEQPADMTITERRVWISTKVAEAEEVIESDLIALCHTIKKDLVRKLLLKDGKSVAKLDSFTSAKLQELLDKPEVYFTCTQTCNAAKKTYNWIEIANHACTANSMGEKNYGDRRKGLALTACIPVGWQPDVIELAEGFKGLYTVVEAVARAKHLASGVSLASNPFSFPSSQSAIVSDHRWKMKCALTTCWTGFCRLNDIVSRDRCHVLPSNVLICFRTWQISSLTSQSILSKRKPLSRDWAKRINPSRLFHTLAQQTTTIPIIRMSTTPMRWGSTPTTIEWCPWNALQKEESADPIYMQ